MIRPSVDRAFTLEVLQQLVSIDSVNPAFPGDAAGTAGRGEAAIAEYARTLLEEIGLETSVYEAPAGRPSVVGVLRGTGGGRSLMLNGHVDTVGPGAMAEPFSPRVEGNRLYGRGSYDMKSGVAACVAAVHFLARGESRPRGDVVLALVADEESESLGMQEVLRHHKVDGAIVAEPTDMRVCLAHKGFVWLAVTAHGVAYHGSDYERGVDANLRMVRALGPLADLQERLLDAETHPLVGPASVHLGRLDGGDGPSIYAGRCRGQIEIRTIPGAAGSKAVEEVRRAIEGGASDLPSGAIELETTLVRPPFEAAPDSRVAALAESAAASVLGERPATGGVPFWTDAAFVRERGTDTILFGPSGAGAHADEEWVDLESVYDCAEIFARVAIDYCGR